MVYLRPVSLGDIFDCFSYKRRRHYIGIDWNLFKEGSTGWQDIEDFLDYVASKARRWWTPYWFLNLLALFGNDNSIVRCRSQRLSSLHRRLTNGIQITDIKEKWGTLRIYGSFTYDIEVKLAKLEEKINPLLEAY